MTNNFLAYAATWLHWLTSSPTEYKCLGSSRYCNPMNLIIQLRLLTLKSGKKSFFLSFQEGGSWRWWPFLNSVLGTYFKLQQLSRSSDFVFDGNSSMNGDISHNMHINLKFCSVCYSSLPKCIPTCK